MQIDYLADHLEWASLLASWHYQEWKDLLPDWTFERALAELQSHTGRRRIPTTLVAVEDGRPRGSASLMATDLPGWECWSPWVASVFVVPECRGRGLGRRLVNRTVEEAASLGASAVFLFTAEQLAYYQELGWSLLCRALHRGQEVAILWRPTGV
jgi:predicted N-acetyltransferase YhbS